MKKISTKLIVTIIFILMIISIINSILRVDNLKKEELKLENELVQRLETRLKLNLSIPIWNLQTNLINDIINTEMLNKSIDSITIFDEDKKKMLEYISDENPKEDFLSKQFYIKFEDKIIAEIFIKYNHNVLNNRINKQISQIIYTSIITIIILIFIIKIIVDNLLSKKLILLSSKIKHFKENKTIDNIQIDYEDEIGYLSEEFNNMQVELKKNWDELNKLNDTLEEKVKIEVEKNRTKELQILEQAKLVQMGEMIGNIAHQWRQPLSAISTIASSMTVQKEMDILEDKVFYKNIDNIIEKVMFLSDTIDTFRNFIKSETEIQDVNISITVKETLNIVESTLKEENIKLILNVKDNISYKGYHGELSQVIINLLNNSKDALLSNKIENKIIQIDLFKQNDKIFITVLDNAGGIPKDIFNNIFEPYFTTKHQSQGTGIGLYMCKKLLNERNCDIYVKNEQNGAKFYIEIPI